MLQDFRRFSKAFLYIVIAAFVGTIIFAWGADITSSKFEKGLVGEVNGQEITRDHLDRVFRGYYEQFQQSSKRDLTDEERMQLLDMSFNEIVTSILYRQEMEKLGLVMTDLELAKHLELLPPQEVRQAELFLTEQGGFDYQKYVQSMRDPSYVRVWQDIESFMRSRVTNWKLQELAMMAARVTGEDVKREFINNNELMKFEYAVVFRDQLRSPEIVNDTSEVLEYYRNHTDDYFRQAEAGLKYIVFEKVPTESDSIATMQQARSIYDEIMDGADFSQLAFDFSDDPSAQPGGDVGWFPRGEYMEWFGGAALEAAFALADSGDVSEPVRTEKGWHVIMKTGERAGEGGRREIRASQILSRFAPSGQTIDDLRNKAHNFLELVDELGFDKAAAELGLEVKQTGGFVKGDYAGTLAEARRVNEFAFSSKVGTVSRVIEEPGRIVVARLDRFRPGGVPPVDSVFTTVNRDLTDEKLMARALAGAQEIYDLVVAGTALKEAAAQVGFEYYVSPLISRLGTVEKAGRDPSFLGAAFGLTESDPLSRPILINRGAAVIQLLERKAPNLELYTVEQDSIHQSMLNEEAQRLMQVWHSNLLDQSKIEDFRSEIYDMY